MQGMGVRGDLGENWGGSGGGIWGDTLEGGLGSLAVTRKGWRTAGGVLRGDWAATGERACVSGGCIRWGRAVGREGGF